MAFARRPARLRFVRSYDNRAANRNRPETRRLLFRALPYARMSGGAERLVLPGQRLVFFQAGHARNARSEHLEQLVYFEVGPLLCSITPREIGS